MFRFTLAAFALIPLTFSQSLPAYRWVAEVDGSGKDSFAGLGVDAQGNTYIAGSTYSATFPVKAAVQNHLASAGLYRIDGPGAAYAGLALTSASSIAVDPLNGNILYATSASSLLRSTDGGATFSTLTLPSSQPVVLAINPVNDQILYAGTFDQGILKSTDGGATWNAANNGLTGPNSLFGTSEIWIDPSVPNVLFATTQGSFVRSADSGASWQIINKSLDVISVAFDSSHPGTLYATALGNTFLYKSTDHGQTFTTINIPFMGSIAADPNHAGRLLGSAIGGIFESDDGGITWTQKISMLMGGTNFPLVADWVNGYLYTVTAPSSVLRISADLQTVTPVGPAEVGNVNGIAVQAGHAYVAVLGTRDVYVTKLDPSGNVVYSTFFGGSSDDSATAMAVDPAGNVYVTGSTTSLDFPVTKGAYASTGGSFLFRLNPDGSLGYSTHFAAAAPASIAVDSAGSAYLAGSTGDNLPVTPGAYQTACNCESISTGFLTIFRQSGFLTKFDPSASSLIYSTYLGGVVSFSNAVSALALASDGSAYLGGANGIYHLNATGSTLLASLPPTIGAQAMAVGPDGSLYIAGEPGSGTNQFQTTPGSFEPAAGPPTALAQGGLFPIAAVEKVDAQLKGVVEATYFGGSYNLIKALALDSAGNVYLGGYTNPQGLPTRTPFQGGFSTTNGFLSELSGDLSTLLFSSYLGDTEHFAVQAVAASPNGNIVIGGATGQADSYSSGPMNIYVNSLTLAPPPALRIDSVENAASLLDGPISAGETIVVAGAGFGNNPQLSIGGTVLTPISTTATSITAVVPQSVPAAAAQFQVQTAGSNSNSVLIPVSASSPGIFAQNGSGYGQGYILNKDGTLNTPSNPAAPGDNITIFATGAGPVSLTQGYAVTGFPVIVRIDGLYADGVDAVMSPAQGLPGSVFQITVTIPNPANLVAANPNLKNFQFPPLVSVVMQIDGASSQNGITLSIAP